MQRKPLPWSIKTICNMIDKGTLTFDNPVQRPGNQWKDPDKSLLIHSVLTMFVPDIYAIQSKKEVNGKMINTYDTVDGKQRLNIFYDFLNDKWTLTKLDPITLETTGETFDISDKTFSQLPEQVQNAIKEYNITARVIELEEDEDEEAIIEEIFYRLNNGKAVSKEHLALVSASHEVQKFCHRITLEHKLFTELATYSESALKKSDIQMTIMQTLVLIAKLNYSSFAAKDIEEVLSKRDITNQVLELTEKAFTAITETFANTEDKKVLKFIAKVNIPIMAYVFANSDNKAETAINLLQYVTKDIKPSDKYKDNTGSGNVKKEKVVKRIKAMLEICNVIEKPITQTMQEQLKKEINIQESEPDQEVEETVDIINSIIHNVAK